MWQFKSGDDMTNGTEGGNLEMDTKYQGVFDFYDKIVSHNTLRAEHLTGIASVIRVQMESLESVVDIL